MAYGHLVGKRDELWEKEWMVAVEVAKRKRVMKRATLSKGEDKATSTSNIGLLMLVAVVTEEDEDKEAK